MYTELMIRTMQSLDPCLMIYDSDCGICSRFSRLVDFFDTRKKITVSSITDAETRGLLSTIPIALRRKSFHLRLQGGKILSGAEAVPDLLKRLPIGFLFDSLMVHVPLSMRVVESIYLTFSRLHDTSACAHNETADPEVPRATRY